VLRRDISIQNGEVFFTTSALSTTKLTSRSLQIALLKHDSERNVIKGARRGKFDIIAEILLFCEYQKTKTSIMYKTNLNYSQIKSQMQTLTSQGLLAKNLNKHNTTQKGYPFLELFA